MFMVLPSAVPSDRRIPSALPMPYLQGLCLSLLGHPRVRLAYREDPRRWAQLSSAQPTAGILASCAYHPGYPGGHW
jgi:hypothetical protein